MGSGPAGRLGRPQEEGFPLMAERSLAVLLTAGQVGMGTLRSWDGPS